MVVVVVVVLVVVVVVVVVTLCFPAPPSVEGVFGLNHLMVTALQWMARFVGASVASKCRAWLSTHINGMRLALGGPSNTIAVYTVKAVRTLEPADVDTLKRLQFVLPA